MSPGLQVAGTAPGGLSLQAARARVHEAAACAAPPACRGRCPGPSVHAAKPSTAVSEDQLWGEAEAGPGGWGTPRPRSAHLRLPHRTSRRGRHEPHFRGCSFSVGDGALRQRRHVAVHQSPRWEGLRRPWWAWWPSSEDPWGVGRAEGLCRFPGAWAPARPPWLRPAVRRWTCRSTRGRPVSLLE